MDILNLTKIPNGFTIAEKGDLIYLFESFIIDESGTTVNYVFFNNEAGNFGTNQGIIFLNTNCSINGIVYNSIDKFSTELYK